jgi:4-hydroxysphinganine ceramide fatty acyl 2-hydroxylase
MIHGIHHAFPMDRYRLVMPPAPGFAIIYLFLGYPL